MNNTSPIHKRLDKNVEELKKLEALKYNLTQLIIHDLQSPISSIMTSLDLFEQRYKSRIPYYTSSLIDKIKRNCHVQLDLINDILEISRMENNELRLEKRKIDIPSLLEECLIQVEPFAVQKEIKLNTSIEKKPFPVIADGIYLHRTIINLIMNSIKYSERGGSVTISVHYNKKDSKHTFCIKDAGLGIERENINKIFDRFFQVNSSSLKRSRRGLGLGLAFCRMAVEAHGGRIWAESKEGHGSSIYFYMGVRH